MKLLADATLPLLPELFSQFNLSTYHHVEELKEKLTVHDILLCRSTLTVNEALLSGSSIRCVATASSGCDHIDNGFLNQNKIALFNAKGSNAQAVADYVTASVAYLQKQTILTGNKACVIGVGEVGSRVVKRLQAAGFEVIGFDPPKALRDTEFESCAFEALLSCDLITLHANLHDERPFCSRNLLDKRFFANLVSNPVIINASRGGIVDEEALLQAKDQVIYCTDVFLNEPNVNRAIIDYATLCTPHIAGHSIEAKKAAVIQISEQLHRQYGLQMPPLPQSLLKPESLSPASNWQETILFLYNPVTETNYLKQQPESFASLRKAHSKRHDFTCFDSGNLNVQLKQLLGFKCD